MVRVEVEEHEDRCLIRLDGEVDMSNAPDVWSKMVDAISNSVSAVTIDLSPTRYLDSAGIRLLFQLADLLGSRRRDLVLVVPEDAPIRHSLELTGLPGVARVLTVADD
jgi:stage II sporulation protein AA (anti-sigma F factor antagonist)